MKTLRLFSIIACALLVVFWHCNPVDAYDKEVTHPKITEMAVAYSGMGIYLTDNFGDEFSQGFESLVNGRSVLYWLREGSVLEDSPMCRATNHFHDPLMPWTMSFMSDDTTALGISIRSYCEFVGWPYSLRKSSVTWGTGYQGPAPDGAKIGISNQLWGWDNAREYYHQALTAASATEREENFAKNFRALGQVIHLIEDGAQPAHVRNDFTSHLTFTGIETINPINWLGSQYEHYVKNHPGLVTNAAPVYPSFAAPSLTDFWDTEEYKGFNPSTSRSLGIAEFTNANYFSDFTIPNNNPTVDHTYPYPSVNSDNAQICKDYTPDLLDIRRYISRKDKGACPPPSEARTADHFATPSILNPIADMVDGNISTLKLWLDGNVHNTYAKELLPRAIGYSSSLLDYFYRAKIDLVSVSSAQYAVANNSAEDMNGTFSLYYDDTAGDRHPVPGATWSLSINANDQSAPVTVTAPDTPEPQEAGKYILVFQGTLGNEDGAVAGKVVSLEGGIWEDWTGSYNLIDRETWNQHVYNLDKTAYIYFNYASGLFTVDTEKHTWTGGWFTAESPDPNIVVEGGAISLNANTGSHPLPGFSSFRVSRNRGWMRTPLTGENIPMSGCTLKMNIPVANVGYEYYGPYGNIYFLVILKITNGTSDIALTYALSDTTFNYSSYYQEYYIYIPKGELELPLVDAFNHLVNFFWWWPLGDINDWGIEEIQLAYYIAGKNNTMNVEIDYIDFLCE